MSIESRLDRNMDQMIKENGLHSVLEALVKWCSSNGYNLLADKLRFAYQYIPVKPVDKL